MRNYLLFDDPGVRRQLLPLTFTRPIADIRVGILTIIEKWAYSLNSKPSYLTESYLQEKFPSVIAERNILINAAILPDDNLVSVIRDLQEGEALKNGDTLLAVNLSKEETSLFDPENFVSKAQPIQFKIQQIVSPASIFQFNAQEIANDFNLFASKVSQTLPIGSQLLGRNIFVEEGAKINFALINSETGPVYIGKDVEIMEGAMIRGPFAACEGAVVKMGSKIYGATTLGPNTVVGGEVKNCVFFGNSNKGHEGYLGDSVIGEWCNLGADTNNSNLKNNFSTVKVWNYAEAKFNDTGLQKYGVVMADHVKTAINTAFNTGTVVGVGCNIACNGFPSKFVADFSWVQNEQIAEFDFTKFCNTASSMMKTKKNEFNDTERRILEHVFDTTRTHKLS
ncbi:putative sugar nucleotidyl transferase [Solitalea lacus]|uniref:putative sugar nucleotidyl transferase n=1 Tax=Solitalea lacus TaxID=2911172 RepID=UPI001EDBD22B|nr:putative sugar nucleotidyl transferase [Solitalea lacus]UKJ09021.1 glucose-1-phosphate thymidylyltransferase [Solitalea lacus]